MFKNYTDMVRGLGDAKISVCFPRSMTNPEIAGDVETMTLRYLESIAARSLIVGHCPTEMLDLFGYNPVIESDVSDPAGQIDAILSNLPGYADLIERNYHSSRWRIQNDKHIHVLRVRRLQVKVCSNSATDRVAGDYAIGLHLVDRCYGLFDVHTLKVSFVTNLPFAAAP